ncbi:MAG: hypothetical protein ACREV4_15085 [Gammaproteobacteria bacterium]
MQLLMEAIAAMQSTHMPVLLITLGLTVLMLVLISGINKEVELSEKQERLGKAISVVLVVLGFLLFVIPTDPQVPPPPSSPATTAPQ